MNHAKLSAIGLALLLAACTGGAQNTGVDLAQDAAVGLQRNLSAADIAALKDTCAQAAPAVIAASSPSAPAPLRDTAIYPYSFCYQLLTGQPNNADQTSLTWLPKVLAITQDVAQVAGVVLPIALKALPLVAAAL